jgi:glycosyltransferase involved in cell wall biosynthesis
VTESTSAPIVSVIMSIHDSAATVDTAIRSLIGQTETDWELVLIDDGSRDDGAERVAKYNDPRIRIVRSGERKGLACRLNEAVTLARGAFIARMDADDICYPERLKTQVTFLQANPDIDLVASKALVFRRAGEIVGVMAPPVAHEDIIARPYNGFVFPHPTWCGRAAWFRTYKYDEEMWITQDQELLLRTAQQSRFATIDRILLGYRKEGISLSKSACGRMLFSRALWRQAGRTGTKNRAIAQIAKHIAKFAADMVAVGLRAEGWLLRQKIVTSLTEEETAQWRALWRDMGAGNETGVQIQIEAQSARSPTSSKRQLS